MDPPQPNIEQVELHPSLQKKGLPPKSPLITGNKAKAVKPPAPQNVDGSKYYSFAGKEDSERKTSE